MLERNEPANVPGSPAGEHKHRINLNEDTWPKGQTRYGPNISQSGTAGCWPTLPELQPNLSYGLTFKLTF